MSQYFTPSFKAASLNWDNYIRDPANELINTSQRLSLGVFSSQAAECMGSNMRRDLSRGSIMNPSTQMWRKNTPCVEQL